MLEDAERQDYLKKYPSVTLCAPTVIPIEHGNDAPYYPNRQRDRTENPESVSSNLTRGTVNSTPNAIQKAEFNKRACQTRFKWDKPSGKALRFFKRYSNRAARRRLNASVTQSVEFQPETLEVTGSNPVGGTDSQSRKDSPGE